MSTKQIVENVLVHGNGVLLENLSPIEPLVILKHFGPGNPDLLVGQVLPA